MHPLADARRVEQVDAALLEHAGADAALAVRTRLRASTMTDSMPARCSKCERMRPAGPAPTIPT